MRASIPRWPQGRSGHGARDRAVLASAGVKTGGLLLLALGAALFLEGLPYFVSPAAVRRYLDWIARMSDPALRVMGFVMMTVGLLLAWAATR